ncbi:2,5-diamino-6-(ribosylamino)-4(3H)-pyrimidinone 5'-phosphate reductase [archaeon SCG-AAA382B04]|nr:2,5-diamino-6-(ribosylamino)-4(3H)-pyrimidinone 5'-phosphate reductase [archaeon SCG-AAA382B04]
MSKPFVLINSAITADGKLSTREKMQIEISSKEDFERVKRLREKFDAIMVGVGTVLADNPSLKGNIIRVVADSGGKTPLNSKVLNGSNRAIIALSERAPRDKRVALEEKAEVLVCGEEKVDLNLLLEKLGSLGISKLMVEGGGTLNWSFFAEELVDQLYTYIGNFVVGGKRAPTLVDGEGVREKEEAFELELSDMQRLGEGVLLKWDVK